MPNEMIKSKLRFLFGAIIAIEGSLIYLLTSILVFTGAFYYWIVVIGGGVYSLLVIITCWIAARTGKIHKDYFIVASCLGVLVFMMIIVVLLVGKRP